MESLPHAHESSFLLDHPSESSIPPPTGGDEIPRAALAWGEQSVLPRSLRRFMIAAESCSHGGWHCGVFQNEQDTSASSNNLVIRYCNCTKRDILALQESCCGVSFPFTLSSAWSFDLRARSRAVYWTEHTQLTPYLTRISAEYSINKQHQRSPFLRCETLCRYTQSTRTRGISFSSYISPCDGVLRT